MHSFQNRLRHNCNGNVRLFINSSGRIKKHIWIPTFLYTVEHSVIINKKSYLGLLLPQFAALSRTSTPQILPPPPPKWCNCAYGFCTHDRLSTKF